MEVTKLWAENKKAIVTTIIVVIVALLVIKFFDLIFWGAVLCGIAVAGVLAWNHVSKKHGGSPSEVLKAAMNEIWGSK